MSVIEDAKRIYGNASFPAAVCDSDLNILWENREGVGDILSAGSLSQDAAERLRLGMETYARCNDGSAARFLPVNEQGRTLFTVEIYSNLSVKQLICASSALDELDNQRESTRRHLSGVLNALNMLPASVDQEQTVGIRSSVILALQRVLSSDINFRQLCRLFARGIQAKMTGIDTRLEPVIGYLGQVLTAEGTVLECRIDQRVTGCCDYELFECVLVNLVTNAQKYAVCEDTKKILLSLTLSDDKKNYVLSVSDNGTKADVSEIEKFSYVGAFAPETESQERLGLALARLMCERMNGSFELSQSKSGGLTVTLSIPRENGRSDTVLCMDYPEHYTSYFGSCFCILAKAADTSHCKL